MGTVYCSRRYSLFWKIFPNGSYYQTGIDNHMVEITRGVTITIW